MSSDRPSGGVNYPRTYQEFRDWFPDDDACLAYLERLRWPGGFVCPVCDCTEAWRTGRKMWMCTSCKRKTSATAGTIFHRSHTPLSTWFAAIWLVTSQKNGVSAQGLQDALGFGSYETAWAWLHKLRRAMVRPDRELLGNAADGVIVELDQSFLGAKGGTGGGTKGKTPITIAVERTPGGRLGRVRLDAAEKSGGLDIIEFATEVITPGTMIHTDGAGIFQRLPALGYGHQATPSHIAGNLVENIDAVMPARTSSLRSSNAGAAAPCITGSARRTCPTTSMSSRSGSTGVTPEPAACSSTGSCSKRLTPTHIRSRS